MTVTSSLIIMLSILGIPCIIFAYLFSPFFIVCCFSSNPEYHDWEHDVVQEYYTDDDTPVKMERILERCKRCGRWEDDQIDW